MIPARAYPVAARLAGRLGLAHTLEQAAVKITEVAPQDREPMRPVAIFPEDRERIVSAGSGSTLKQEFMRLDGHEGINLSTCRYELRDALATPYGVYQLRGSHLPSGGLSPRDLAGAHIDRRASGFYAATHVSHSFFGHWIMDGLPAALLAGEDEDLVLPIPPKWRRDGAYDAHTLVYADRLGLPRRTEDFIHYERLVLCRDFGQNAHRRARTVEIRDRVQHAIRALDDTPTPAQGVYLARGDTGVVRRLLNEDALIAALEARGFEVVAVDAPLEEIWRKVAGVPQVVSLEGSHMAHAMLAARADALHLAINPADRFYLAFADYTAALDMRLATTVAPRDGDGWRVDVDAVLRMLDREAP